MLTIRQMIDLVDETENELDRALVARTLPPLETRIRFELLKPLFDKLYERCQEQNFDDDDSAFGQFSDEADREIMEETDYDEWSAMVFDYKDEALSEVRLSMRDDVLQRFGVTREERDEIAKKLIAEYFSE